MGRFTAIEIRPIGEHDEKYGTRYWGRVEDSQMPVSFNLMNPVDIPIGAGLKFEERVIKETGPQSKNPGSEYLFLRKVKVLGGSPLKPAQTSTVSVTNDTSKLNELIYADTQEILRILNQTVPPKSLKEKWDETTAKEDVVDNDVGDEPMDLSAIPFS